MQTVYVSASGTHLNSAYDLANCSDLREECIKECKDIARTLKLHNKAFFAVGDMRDVKQTVHTFRSSKLGSDGKVHFGGMFTSVPFWKLETVS